MTTLPTPKYAVGDVMWLPGTVSARATRPCPDCLGTKKWTVTTPAGSTMQADCMRCGTTRLRDVPSLEYLEHTPQPKKFVIDGIEVSTKPKWHNETDLVHYSSFNQGSVRESALMTEEAAMTVSKLQAAEKNKDHLADPEQVHRSEIGSLVIEDARFNEFKNGLWKSWYAFRNIAEYIEEWAEANSNGDRRNVGEELGEILNWKVRAKGQGGYATLSHLEAVVRSAECVAASAEDSRDEALAKLQLALADMPKFARAALGADDIDDLGDDASEEAA